MLSLRNAVGALVAGTVAGLLAAPALAQSTITRWQFNVAANNTSSPSPNEGSGTASLVGGTTGQDNGGAPNDSASVPNRAWNIIGFPAQGVGSGTAGVQFAVSTVGFDAVSVRYDMRASNTATRWTQLQISTDGTTFTNFGAPLEHTAGGDQWMTRVFDLSAVAGVNNNPNFRFRVLQIFSPNAFVNGDGTPFAANTGYAPATQTSTYPGTSALRFDLVTVSGTARPFSPVSGNAGVLPRALCNSTGGSIALEANVSPGLNPPSTFALPTSGVTVDLTPVGGTSSVALSNTSGNQWTAGFAVPSGVSAGTKALSFTVRDDQNRTATFSTSLGVADCSTSSTTAFPVVISAIYSTGNAASGPPSAFNADYIELYNRSANPVSIDGWSVQYAAPTTSAGFELTDDLVVLSGTMLPGQYRLIRFATPGTNGADLPRFDFARAPGGGGLNSTGGRVALANQPGLLFQACNSTAIRDLLGYGNAVCFTGLATGPAPDPVTDNSAAVTRGLGGAQDTRQNFNDFQLAPAAPRNRAFGGFLAGFVLANPPVTCAGTAISIDVDAVPGAAPASTGLTVRANLAPIGGSANQLLSSPGGSGAGIWNLSYIVPTGIPQGTYSIIITTSDAQGRSDVVAVPLTVATCTPSATPVVISGIFGGGGNTGATVDADFVELHNRTDAPVSLVGWSVQYAPSAGLFNDVIPLTGTIPASGYYLIKVSASGAGLTLPTPDDVATPAINMGNNSGRVALVQSTTAIGGAFSSPLIKDLVGYGSASTFLGVAAVPTLSNSLQAFRKDNGCLDRRQNVLDFDVVATDTLPRNSQSPTNVCPPLPPSACNPADIAQTDGTESPDNCVNNGDFSLFFSSFFSAVCSGDVPCNPADIAATDGAPGADGNVDNGDFQLFFSSFFSANCPGCAG